MPLVAEDVGASDALAELSRFVESCGGTAAFSGVVETRGFRIGDDDGVLDYRNILSNDGQE